MSAANQADVCVRLKGGKLPDVRQKENSPALECAIDISVSGKFNDLYIPALPGFKPGYCTGKAPAAGAVQFGEDKLMQHFISLNKRLVEGAALVDNLK